MRVPKRIVVKLGTGVLTSALGKLDSARIAGVCAQLAAVRGAGTEVLVVSSGAVGLGMDALGLAKRPRVLAQKQACAAIGQSRLMQTWQAAFEPHGLTVAQVLLTHDDLRSRGRYLGVQGDAAPAAALRRGAGHQRERHGERGRRSSSATTTPFRRWWPA